MVCSIQCAGLSHLCQSFYPLSLPNSLICSSSLIIDSIYFLNRWSYYLWIKTPFQSGCLPPSLPSFLSHFPSILLPSLLSFLYLIPFFLSCFLTPSGNFSTLFMNWTPLNTLILFLILERKHSVFCNHSSVVKNLPANAGDIREAGLSLGWEEPSEKGMATHSSILAWRISWTAKHGGLQSGGCKESHTTEHTLMHVSTIRFIVSCRFFIDPLFSSWRSFWKLTQNNKIAHLQALLLLCLIPVLLFLFSDTQYFESHRSIYIVQIFDGFRWEAKFCLYSRRTNIFFFCVIYNIVKIFKNWTFPILAKMRAWVQSSVWELRSHKPCGAAKKNFFLLIFLLTM